MLGSLHSREFGILGNSARPSWARQSGTIGVAGGELVGNANGVILELVGAQLGLEVSVGSAGMTIVLQ